MLKLFKDKTVLNADEGMHRRDFLNLALAAAVSTIIPVKSFADSGFIHQSERILCLYNPYTKENLESLYWRDGEYLPEALTEINHILRDIRTGRIKAIDRNLLDLLFNLQQKIGTSKPFHIISGYRTPKSNAILSRSKRGVAKNSFHIYGKAIDVRVPGHSLKLLRRAAMELKGGGVGYYPRSRFIHIDVGDIRYWWG